jgi:hypothetical protein
MDNKNRVLRGNKNNNSRRWWLMPVILTTQEAEIRRVMGSKPAWANSSSDPILKNPITKKGWKRGSGV